MSYIHRYIIAGGERMNDSWLEVSHKYIYTCVHVFPGRVRTICVLCGDSQARRGRAGPTANAGVSR
eukprot:14966721-Heterocapsa_arctica.AAC.1